MYEQVYPERRFNITIKFLQKHLNSGSRILDLGVNNPMSELMAKENYIVTNTTGEDLDDDQSAVKTFNGDAVTAFEIFEHLVAPYNVLKAIPTKHVFISVPLKLWFAKAYKNPNDIWDQHYHEFEPWQLDYVLEKAGWKIVDSIKFTNPVNKLGFKPLLRKFTARYYLIYAIRN